MSSDLAATLKRFPRVDLGVSPTPLDPMPRLGEALGIELFVKRDDALPLAMGGNKVRQLEYYLGPGQEQGADTVLITGAVQSNFVRLCVAAANRLGWKAVVQLEDRVPGQGADYHVSGNVLLDQILGAEIHSYPDGEDEAGADRNLDRLAQKLRAEGRHPHVVHLGIEHPPLGGLGYVAAAMETFQQFEALGRFPDHLVIPSGSGLTHAGFLAGARAIGWKVPIHGICVRRAADPQSVRVTRRVEELNILLQRQAAANGVRTYDSVLEPGYGQINDAVLNAISLAAQNEGLLLDPVYSGRAFAGLMALVESGDITQGETVGFVHTGGLPAIFAYQQALGTATL